MATGNRVHFVKDLSGLKKIRDKKFQHLYKLGKRVAVESKKLVPVRTGYLRSTIGVRSIVNKRQIIVRVGASANYANYVERKRHFLRDALRRVVR